MAFFIHGVKFFTSCTNRNHSHERLGKCESSSWIPRHDCYYCGPKGYANGTRWLESKETIDPCGHYARGSMLSQIKRINIQKGS